MKKLILKWLFDDEYKRNKIEVIKEGLSDNWEKSKTIEKELDNIINAINYITPNFKEMLPLITELLDVKIKLGDDCYTRENLNFLYIGNLLTKKEKDYLQYKAEKLTNEIEDIKNGKIPKEESECC